ncbi:hypothetical protein T492DRAFT_1121776 [Pavlovales sp. CCMP2436]|nr:hypothetical protein T492DRAFT_1121776 [Pavlovales sp. CCMP2436]
MAQREVDSSAAATELGQQGGARATSELECSPYGCLHTRDDEPLLPRADDDYQQAGHGYWSGVQEAPDSEEEGMSGLKRWKTSDCDEPDCAYKCSGPEMLRGHKRSKHGAEMLCCGHPGCEFETAWLTSLRNHRHRHRIAPQSPPPAALQASAPIESRPDAESAERELLREALRRTPRRRRRLRPSQQGWPWRKSTRPHYARSCPRPKQAEQNKAAAIAELEAVRQSAEAAAQAAAEAHGRELRAAVAEAEGKTATAVAEVEVMRGGADATALASTEAHWRERAAAYERSLLVAVAEAEGKTVIVAAVAELEARRQNANAITQAATEAHGRECAVAYERSLLAAVAKAEGTTAAAIAKAVEAAAAEAHERELRAAVAEEDGKTTLAVAEAEEMARRCGFATGLAMAEAFEHTLFAAESVGAPCQHRQRASHIFILHTRSPSPTSARLIARTPGRVGRNRTSMMMHRDANGTYHTSTGRDSTVPYNRTHINRAIDIM